jgi:NTE family protein
MDADLVLEGGGVKGIGLVGAVRVLQDEGYRFHRVAGTSAGAVVGALVAAGMPAEAMEATMRHVDYRRFEDPGLLDRFGPLGKGLSLLFEQGVYEGDYLRRWLHDLLVDLGRPTFGDLKFDDPGSSLPPGRSYRLVVIASDVTRGRLVRLPWDYPLYGLDPDAQPIADAVRASMSIPFFYEPVVLAGHGPGGEETASYLVDGGLLSNYPIDTFDRSDGQPPRWPTFGLKLSARPASPVEPRFPVAGTLTLAKAMIGTMMNFHDQMHIDDPAVIARTIFIDSLRVKATDFDVDETTREALYESGRRAATRFLHGDGAGHQPWDFAAYVREFRAASGSPRL